MNSRLDLFTRDCGEEAQSYCGPLLDGRDDGCCHGHDVSDKPDNHDGLTRVEPPDVCNMKHQRLSSEITVLVIIKLTKFSVALQLRCGSCKLIF